MKYYLIIIRSVILISAIAVSGCGRKNNNDVKQDNPDSLTIIPLGTVKEDNISIDVYDFKNFKHFLQQKNDTVYVINFWATWCTPCVKELPNFEKIRETYSNKKVKIILVSMDFPNKIKSQLIPFIKKKGLKSQIIVLDEPDANSWINKIDANWSGAVPATLIYNKQKRFFYPKPFTYNELETEINKLIITKN